MTNKNYPKAWPRFMSQVHEVHSTAPKDLVDNFSKLARWSARFRLAKSFKALDLGDHYSSLDTPQLYSAITRIFLVYTAFETYCQIIGLKPNEESQVKMLQDSQFQQDTIQIIRGLDPQGNLSKFLLEHLHSRLSKQMMQEFINGKDVNISFLARCTRHIFAHGILAANSAGISANKFHQISQVISDFLLDCMDADFDRRVP